MTEVVKSKWGLFIGAIALATLVGFLCLREDDSKCARPMRTAEIKLANRTVTACGFPEEASTNQSLSVRGTLPYVLAATGRVDKVIREEVIASGARVIGVLSRTTFLIECDSATLAKLSRNPHLAAVAEFLPGDKIDPRLRKRVEGGADAVDVTVLSLAPADRDGLRTWVESQSGEVLKGCLNGEDSVTVRVPVALLGDLARRGDVRWLEAFTRPKLLNDMAVEPAAMNVREVWDAHGLTGKGQIITTSDSGIDTGNLETMHRDLRNQLCGFGVIDECLPYDEDGHGTHTAGSIVGDGTMSDGQIKGVAHGAKLWAWFCLSENGSVYLPDTAAELLRPDQQHHPAYIHSASWGFDEDGTYNFYAAIIDQYVWEHPDFLMAVAAGNAGKNGEMTVGNPATAKNVLAVGATQNLRTWSKSESRYPTGTPEITAGYSSRGPCTDGRIKPDVMAPGTAILSTRAYDREYDFDDLYENPNTNYACSCGTSMATPLASGAVALIREWLVTEGGFTNETPTAALMKAIITGGAKGVGLPNNEQGWGRVDVGETLYPSNRAVKFIDRIPFAMHTNFTYVIETTNAAPLDVQLVWIDCTKAAGGSNADPQLVNDLNLIVDSETNGIPTRWLGNGGRVPDSLNTSESVRIASAPAGQYTIKVECENIVHDHHEGGAAALYIRGAFDPAALKVEQESESTRVLFGMFVSLDEVRGGDELVFEEWYEKGESFDLCFPEDAPLGDGVFIDLDYVIPETGERIPVNLYFKLGSVLVCETDGDPGNNYLYDSLGRMPNKVTLKMDCGIDVYCRYYLVDTMTEYGLPYWWTIRYLGNRSDEDQTASADPDGDGFSNAAEYADGTDPVDDESFRFKIDSFALTNMTFTCSVKGEWIVETSKTLNDDWKFVVGNNSSRTSTTNCVALPSDDAGSGFYRVRHNKK